MNPIHLRNIPGELETYNHAEILEHFAKWIKPERYLEIGVRDGRILKIISKYSHECYGVDIKFSEYNYDKNVKLFEMSSDEFFRFKPVTTKFDMVFIDGDHSKKQVYKDFMSVKNHVIDDGFVFLHDSYPFDEWMTAPDLSDNCWEAILDIKKNFYDEWEIITLPFNPGLTIMKKIEHTKQLIWKN